jgi:hypothetical protein
MRKQSLVIRLFLDGRRGDNGIKATPGITESWHLRVHIAGAVCYLDVDSAYPPGVQAGKGAAVRSLRSHVSWVQNVVRQFFLYLLRRTSVKTGRAVSTKGLQHLYLLCSSCWLYSWHRRVATYSKDKS